jgi:thymidine phosphorylase
MVQKDKKTPDTLQLRRIAIDTYRENVAYMHRNNEIYRVEGFQALTKVVITANTHQIYAVLNVVDDEKIVEPSELGLSEQAFAQLKMQEGDPVRVAQAEKPASMEAVRRKISGERLTLEDFRQITADITTNRYSRMEMAAFLVATGQHNLDREEVLNLTRAMTESGHRLDWKESLVVDKHCIGGIPGNRTSMLVTPIVAAHGMLMPKTSSRAITSPAGTADTMEVLAKVELTPRELHDIVRRQRACLAWGGTAHLAPADDILISVERPLGIDSQGQMVASILSKKLAAGSTHLLIDIPVGPSAKVRHMLEAQQLRKLFEYTGDRLGLHLEVIITDGSEPIGNGIGPVLEARDVIQVLRNEPGAPADLRQKSLRLAGRLLEFDPDVRGGYGYAIARDILDSGRAWKKMDAMIKAQGHQPISFHPGALQYQVCADESGVVTSIDNYLISKLASLAGAPIDKGAGVDLLKKLGDRVEKGEPLYRVHAEHRSDFKFAQELSDKDTGYRIGRPEHVNKHFLEL